MPSKNPERRLADIVENAAAIALDPYAGRIPHREAALALASILKQPPG